MLEDYIKNLIYVSHKNVQTILLASQSVEFLKRNILDMIFPDPLHPRVSTSCIIATCDRAKVIIMKQYQTLAGTNNPKSNKANNNGGPKAFPSLPKPEANPNPDVLAAVGYNSMVSGYIIAKDSFKNTSRNLRQQNSHA
jgi:hypothetical protein